MRYHVFTSEAVPGTTAEIYDGRLLLSIDSKMWNGSLRGPNGAEKVDVERHSHTMNKLRDTARSPYEPSRLILLSHCEDLHECSDSRWFGWRVEEAQDATQVQVVSRLAPAVEPRRH